MKISEVVVGWEESCDIGNSLIVKPSIGFQATLAVGDDPAQVQSELLKRAQSIVREQIDLAREANHLSAKYAEGPRFQVMWSQTRNCVAILPVSIDARQSLPDFESLSRYLGNGKDVFNLTHRHAVTVAKAFSDGGKRVVVDCADNNLKKIPAPKKA